MPDDRNQLISYLATLLALVAVFAIAVIASALSPGIQTRLEVFGLGTITGGLIGVLRMPTRPTSTANVEQADNVTQAPAK